MPYKDKTSPEYLAFRQRELEKRRQIRRDVPVEQRTTPEQRAKNAAAMRAYSAKNKDRINAQRKKKMEDPEYYAQVCAQRKLWRAKDPRYNMWANARNRAKRDGLPFTITKEDIVIPEFCPALGVKLEIAQGERYQTGFNPLSPSLDKIVPSKGYVPGNIVVVSMLANSIKRDATIEQLKQVADFYVGLTRE